MKAIIGFLLVMIMSGCATTGYTGILGSRDQIEAAFCPNKGLLSVEEQTTYPQYVVVRCHDGDYLRFSYESFNNMVRRSF